MMIKCHWKATSNYTYIEVWLLIAHHGDYSVKLKTINNFTQNPSGLFW